MNLPEQEKIRKHWLDAYASEAGELDVLRQTALESMGDTPKPQKRPAWLELLFTYRRLATFVAGCWAIALAFQLAAPDLDTPPHVAVLSDDSNARVFENLSSQRALLLELSDSNAKLESPASERPNHKAEISLPPSVLLLRYESNNRPHALAS